MSLRRSGGAVAAAVAAAGAQLGRLWARPARPDGVDARSGAGPWAGGGEAGGRRRGDDGPAAARGAARGWGRGVAGAPRTVALAAVAVALGAAALLWVVFGHANEAVPQARSLAFGGFAVRSSFASPSDLFKAQPTAISICHPDWRGIREATYGQGLPVLEMVGVVSPAHAAVLLDVLEALPLRQVVFNGILRGSVPLAHALKASRPNVEILFVYHGSPAQSFHLEEGDLLRDVVVAARQGVVSRLGMVKNGIGESFAAGLGVPTYNIWNRPALQYQLRDVAHATQDRRRWRVGVLGMPWINHKNVAVQVISLCSMPDVEIHVLQRPRLSYLDFCQAAIVDHGGLLDHGAFTELVLSMDLVLYVSLTECFPMTVVESISAGIPALTSATSALYTLDPVLRDYLVVAELDSPDRIAASVRTVLDHYDAISLRLWELVPALHAKMERQWRLFVEGLPEAALPDVGQLQYRVPRAALPTAAVPPTRKPAIAFVTYELFPVTSHGGGAGVVIGGLVWELLRRGHDVVVVADFELDRAQRYELLYAAQRRPGDGYLRVRHVAQVLRDHPPTPGSRSIFVEKSRSFARALQLVYEEAPFDMVECFDYAGVAYELLRARAGAAVPYLPASVLVAVRVHGSLQLIDKAERVPASSLDDERRLMYLMEQLGLLGADLLFVQSSFLQRTLTVVYGLHPLRMLPAPPPMDFILQSVRDAAANLTDAEARAWRGSRTFLVYGRMQLVKGIETIVRAAVRLLQAGRPRKTVRFVFAGLDQYSPEHRLMASLHLKSLIPYELRRSFEFAVDRHVDRPTLVRRAAQAHAAIVASTFETFNLALHELAHLRVPVIVSRIPAFVEYFGATEARMFEPDDVDSLAQVLEASVVDDVWAERIRQRGYGLEYGDPLEPYRFYATDAGSAVAERRDLARRNARAGLMLREVDRAAKALDVG